MVENTFDSKGTHSTAREHILQQRSCLRELAPALATEHEQCIVITHMSHHHTYGTSSYHTYVTSSRHLVLREQCIVITHMSHHHTYVTSSYHTYVTSSRHLVLRGQCIAIEEEVGAAMARIHICHIIIHTHTHISHHHTHHHTHTCTCVTSSYRH